MGGGGGSVSNANGGVPASSRKVIQDLKEIVECSELEIYAMLVECDMNPDESVNRLLSQDTFHEVKSKREKKKETKDHADSWTRNVPNRGARSGNDSYNTSRGGRNKYKSNETGEIQGVPVNRRENGARNHLAGSSASSGLLGRLPGLLRRQPPSNSDLPSSKVKKAPTTPSDAVTLSLLPSPAYQSAWASANPGQRTMAEIVKMGRPNLQKNVALPRSSEAQESSSKAPLKDECPSIEKQDVSYLSSSVLKPSAESKISSDQFSESQHLDETLLDDIHRETKTYPTGSPPDVDHNPLASVSSRNLVDDESRDSLVCDDENNKAERHSYEENQDEDVSTSVATGFQQLTIYNEEEQEALPKEEKHAVIIPNHLQVHTSECLHLMFGCFSSGIGSGQPSALNDNLEEPLVAEDDSSFRHPDTNFYGEEEAEQPRNAVTNEQVSYQIDSSTQNYNSATDSKTDAVQHEPPQEEGHQYKFSSSEGYRFENNQLFHPPSETNPQRQNLDTYPNIMQQGYTSSLPNTLLPSGIQDGRESNLHYSPFTTLYNTEISMAEALRAASISPQNAIPSAGQQAATLAQHLALNPYSHQPEMPLGHYGNLISYPFMAQCYNPFMLSAFQQVFPTGNHQSLVDMLMQYKTQTTAPPVPPPSAYGFGGGAVSSNNFPLNPTSAANSYEDVLSSQFNESNHLASSLQQQNEKNNSMASRTTSQLASGSRKRILQLPWSSESAASRFSSSPTTATSAAVVSTTTTTTTLWRTWVCESLPFTSCNLTRTSSSPIPTTAKR
ncbi:putative GBF-interacting protein [Arabidopsis thaliana]